MKRACERPVPICAQVKPGDGLYIWVCEHLQGGFMYSCLEVAVSKYPVLSCCVCAPESESGCGRRAFSFLVGGTVQGYWGAALGRLLEYR